VQTTFIISFISQDRPGLVEALSEVISKHGGNWLESRLSQLAGKFTGLISISLPEESSAALQVYRKNKART
jgi:glycine cleavage system regulatory protein